MGKPRKVSTRRPKASPPSWQPVLTADQLKMLARHAIGEAAGELNELRLRLDDVNLTAARAVVKKAHDAAQSGLGLIALAHQRESVDA